MRIHVMSDIHFETMSSTRKQSFFENFENLNKGDPANVLFLAGDIRQISRRNSRGSFEEDMNRLSEPYKQVFYVPGNHEYYEANFDYVTRFLDGISIPNVTVLTSDKRSLWVGDTVFGDTMWFPDKNAEREDKDCMNDFWLIRDFEPEVYRRHSKFVQNFCMVKPQIALTHHLPLPGCIALKFANSPLNQFFMSDFDAHLNHGNLPKLWIHGHTHTPVDFQYTISDLSMRIYANPLGYPNEGDNQKFWDRVGIDYE